MSFFQEFTIFKWLVFFIFWLKYIFSVSKCPSTFCFPTMTLIKRPILLHFWYLMAIKSS